MRALPLNDVFLAETASIYFSGNIINVMEKLRELLPAAGAIRDASVEFENSAERIGLLFLSIIEAVIDSVPATQVDGSSLNYKPTSDGFVISLNRVLNDGSTAPFTITIPVASDTQIGLFTPDISLRIKNSIEGEQRRAMNVEDELKNGLKGKLDTKVFDEYKEAIAKTIVTSDNVDRIELVTDERHQELEELGQLDERTLYIITDEDYNINGTAHFKNLGKLDSYTVLNEKLAELTYNTSLAGAGLGYGYYRTTVRNRDISVQNILISAELGTVLQVVSGMLAIGEHGLVASDYQYSILMRKHNGNSWGEWTVVIDSSSLKEIKDQVLAEQRRALNAENKLQEDFRIAEKKSQQVCDNLERLINLRTKPINGIKSVSAAPLREGETLSLEFPPIWGSYIIRFDSLIDANYQGFSISFFGNTISYTKNSITTIFDGEEETSEFKDYSVTYLKYTDDSIGLRVGIYRCPGSEIVCSVTQEQLTPFGTIYPIRCGYVTPPHKRLVFSLSGNLLAPIFSVELRISETVYILESGHLLFTNSDVDALGYAGISSSQALALFQEMLEYDCPKNAVWFVGATEPDSGTGLKVFEENIEIFIKTCHDFGINPILCTFPSTPLNDNSVKNDYIRRLPVQVIDVATYINCSTDYSLALFPESFWNADEQKISEEGFLKMFYLIDLYTITKYH